MRRNPNGTAAACGTITSQLTRGYTSQEMLDSLCLVNMNARIQDPQLGRFLSADSIVPNPGYGQSYNRYAYVLNNPLALVDPTGHVSCTFADPKPGCVIHVNGGDWTWNGYDWVASSSGCYGCTGSNLGLNSSSEVQIGWAWLGFETGGTAPGAGGGSIEYGGGIFGAQVYNTSGFEGLNSDSLDIALAPGVVVFWYWAPSNLGVTTEQASSGTAYKSVTPVNPNGQKPQEISCDAWGRAKGMGKLLMHSADAQITFSVGLVEFYAGGGAFSAGCLDPTPFELATCALGTFALSVTWTGGATAWTMSGVIVAREVVPDINEITCQR